MNLPARLAELDLLLPEVSNPGGNYLSVNLRGRIAYVAIQFPIINGEYQFQGRLGEDLTTQDGYRAMQLCALNVLAQVHEKVGFARVEGFNHLDAYYRAAPDWDESPEVVDGASDLLMRVLADRGVHTRAIFGVADLPRHFSVGLTCSLTLRD